MGRIYRFMYIKFPSQKKNKIKGGNLNMRKILSLVLVLSLVLGSMSMAFAATSFSDIEDENVLKAVQRLNAFGIVDGYEDGSYKPGKDITRAEFAKLLVTALGLESAADAAKGVSQFSDVTGTEWYAGAVNVAAGQGIVNGYLDGTYKPDAEVKYSEAVTMLVRALGYKDEFLPGKWPQNYIAKAAGLDITDDVNFQPNGFADRGSVAVLVNNTLDANIIEQKSFGDNDDWVENKHKTLLTERLNFDKYEAIELIETPKVESGLDADQVKFRTTDDSEMNAYDDDDFNLPSSFDVKDEDMLNALENRLGESLNVYTDDDEVIFFETADNAYTVKWGTILDGDADKDEEEITVTFVNGDDKTYDYDDSEVKIYIDNDEEDEDELKGDLFGKFVIADNGDIALADLHKWDDNALIVTDSSADEFDYVAAPDSDKTFEADDFDKVVVMNTAGKVMNMEDLEKDTVVYVNEAEIAESGDEVAYVVAVETAAVNETAKSYDIDTDEYEFETDESGTYDVNEEYGTVSADEDDDFVEYHSAEDELETMTDGEEKVTILFDIVNDVRHIRTDVNVSSSDMFGVVIGAAEDRFDSDEVELKILTASGDEVNYDLDHGSDTDDDFQNIESVLRSGDYDGEADLVRMTIGTIVKYTLDSDGDIDSLIAINTPDENNDNDATDELGANDSTGDYTIEAGELDEDIEKDSIEFKNGGDYTVDSNVVVFDVSDSDADGMDTVKFENLVGIGEGDRLLIVANEDEEVILAVSQDVAADDQYVAYVLDTQEKGDDHFFKLDVFGEGVDKYEIGNTKEFDEEEIAEESIVVFTKNSDDTIDIVAASDKDADTDLPKDIDGADFELAVGQVVDVDGKWLEIDKDADGTKDEKVKLYDDTVMYEEDADEADVDEYDFVLVAQDGTKARVVKRYDIDFEDYDEDGDEEKMFEEDIKHIHGTTNIDDFYFGDGDAPDGGTDVDEGTITYINVSENLIEVDGDVLELDSRVKLVDEDGDTLAIGKDEVVQYLDDLNDDGDVVLEEIVTNDDDEVTKMQLKGEDSDDDDSDDDDSDFSMTADIELTKSVQILSLNYYTIDITPSEDVDSYEFESNSSTDDAVVKSSGEYAIKSDADKVTVTAKDASGEVLGTETFDLPQ